MAKKPAVETDSIYFLKVLLYLVLGTIWIKYHGYVVFPLGLVTGLIFARHEHFQIDRKIEYIVLLVAAFIGLAGAGLFFTLG